MDCFDCIVGVKAQTWKIFVTAFVDIHYFQQYLSSVQTCLRQCSGVALTFFQKLTEFLPHWIKVFEILESLLFSALFPIKVFMFYSSLMRRASLSPLKCWAFQFAVDVPSRSLGSILGKALKSPLSHASNRPSLQIIVLFGMCLSSGCCLHTSVFRAPPLVLFIIMRFTSLLPSHKFTGSAFLFMSGLK